jgi:hypothetical protein
MKTLAIFFALFLFLIVASRASAQEVQVPFDTTTGLDLITAQTDHDLHIFSDVDGFGEARLYRLDTTYTLEITHSDEGKSVRSHRKLSQIEVDTLRSHVRQQIDASHILVDQDGRSELITATTVAGLYYGIALGYAADFNSDGYVASELIGGGMGFFLPFALTAHSEVTRGEGLAATTGMSLGALHGLCIGLLTDADERTNVGLAALASAGEMGAWYAIAKNNKLDAGYIAALNSGALFGAAQGVAIQGLFEDFPDNDATTEHLGIAMLAGSAGGMAAMHYLDKAQNFTEGDVTVVSTGGWLLPMDYWLIALAANIEPERYSSILISMAANVGGIAVGSALVHGRKLSRAEGNYVALGTLAGGLIGAGFGVLSHDAQAASIMTALGASAGYFIVAGAVSGNTPKKESNMQISPNLGALGGLFSPSHSAPGLLNLSMRF